MTGTAARSRLRAWRYALSTTNPRARIVTLALMVGFYLLLVGCVLLVLGLAIAAVAGI